MTKATTQPSKGTPQLLNRGLIMCNGGGAVALCTAVIVGFLADVVASAQENNYGELAARIVKTSASVKPGDIVVIFGGKHNIAVMEELAVQSAKEGGLVTMMLDSDRFERAVYTEVPEKYLEQQP